MKLQRKRLCRLMCGKAQPFRQLANQLSGYASVEAQPPTNHNPNGKAEPFRTLGGKAVKTLKA
jgi:hypothetical protein